MQSLQSESAEKCTIV